MVNLNLVELGDRLFSAYQVTAILSANPIYQWVKVLERDQKPAVIQLLVAPVDAGVSQPVIEYFDQLQSLRRRELIVPQKILSDAEYPLAALYPDLTSEPVSFAPNPLKSAEYDHSVRLLEQASEALFALHNKNLVHGCITPESFIVVENSVRLTQFGYLPLLQQRHLETLALLKQYDQFLAPETAQPTLTSTADIYAFAKLVAQWQPQLLQTAWYRQATAPNPNDRFQRMRELFRQLKAALLELINPPLTIDPPPILPSPAPIADPPVEGIVPRFVLQVSLEPAEAGQVEGAGSYREGKEVTLKAVPKATWQFVEWCGDLSSSQNPATLIVDNNKVVIAQFKKVAVPAPPVAPRRISPPEKPTAPAWASPTTSIPSSVDTEPVAEMPASKKTVPWANPVAAEATSTDLPSESSPESPKQPKSDESSVSSETLPVRKTNPPDWAK